MMRVAFQKSPEEFLSKVGPILEKDAAEHNLILSLCQTAAQGSKNGHKIELQCSTLFNDDEFVIAAVQSPPRNLVLSRATRPEIEKLAEMLANQNVRFPGIVGPSDVASSFAAVWTEMTGQKSVEFMDQIIYSLTKVLFPPEEEGSFRFAKKEEAKIIADWMQAFAKSSLPKAEQLDDAAALARAEGMIAEGRVAVWDVKGKPVAQAAVTGTSDVSRIQAVYTPAEHRGQGYASAVVAHLSQHQLENGKKMCCLYADARNPVSNSIYRKIGYEFVGRSSLYVLDKTA